MVKTRAVSWPGLPPEGVLLHARLGTRTAALDHEGLFVDPHTVDVPFGDVARWGKATLYGRSNPRLLVGLRDGRRGVVNISGHADPVVRKYLNRVSQWVGFPGLVPRGVWYVTRWLDVPESTS
jgi:hypothetical protein